MDDINKQQFVYTREVEVAPVKEDTEKGIIGSDGYTKIVYDSFNISCVTRTVTMDNGSLKVLLDDMHERNQKIPKMTRKGTPVLDKQNVPQYTIDRETFQSEIDLTPEQGKQFLKLTAINDYE